MADASGLAAAQAAAGEIPYKNIALGNPAETFLNAWALTTNVKMRQQEFEGRMHALAEKNRFLEMKAELDRAESARRFEQMELNYGAKMTMADIARERMQNAYEHQWQTFNFKQQQDSTRDADVAGTASDLADLAAEGITKSHPDYFRRVNEIISRHPNLPNSQAKDIRRGAGNEQNVASREERLRLNDDTERFNRNIGRRFYGGNTTVQNWEDFLNPDNLSDATKPKEHWWDLSSAEKMPGFKVIKGSDAFGNPKDIITSVKELNDWKEQWKALQDRDRNIPQAVNRPDLGVFPNEATTLKGKAERALADPYASPEAKAAAHKYLGY